MATKQFDDMRQQSTSRAAHVIPSQPDSLFTNPFAPSSEMNATPIFAFDPHDEDVMRSAMGGASNDTITPFSLPPNAIQGVQANEMMNKGQNHMAGEGQDVDMLRHWAAFVAASSLQRPSTGESNNPVRTPAAHVESSGEATYSLLNGRRASAPYTMPPHRNNRTSSTQPQHQHSSLPTAPPSTRSPTPSRPSSVTGKRKLAHSEVERERRKSIAVGFAALQSTLHPQSSAEEETTKMMPKSVLLKQACNTINDLRVRLEASTSIIASLNMPSQSGQNAEQQTRAQISAQVQGAPAHQHRASMSSAAPSRRSSYANVHSPEERVRSPLSTPSNISSSASSLSSSTSMGAWPQSMTMTSIVPSSNGSTISVGGGGSGGNDTRRRQLSSPSSTSFAPLQGSSAATSCASSTDASLTGSPQTLHQSILDGNGVGQMSPPYPPHQQGAAPDAALELRKAIATLLNCLPIHADRGPPAARRTAGVERRDSVHGDQAGKQAGSDLYLNQAGTIDVDME